MRALIPAVLLLSIACAAARQVPLQPASTPSAAYAPPLPSGLPVINGSTPMVVPADAAVSTTIITTVTDDGKPTETNVQTVPGVSLPPQYMPQVVQLPLVNASNSTNVTAPITGVFASDVDLAKSARNSAAIAFKAAQNALQSSILSRQTAEAAAAAARSAALAAQAAISQATNGYVPSAPEGSPLFSPLVSNPVPGPYPFGPSADQNAAPSGSASPAEPVNGTVTGSKGAVSPFFSVSGNPTQWPGINAADLPQSLALHGGDDKVSATVISCKYSVETKSVHFGQFQCQRKMDAKSGFCDNVPEDAANLLPRLHVIKQRCKSRAGIIMYPQCKHVFVRNPFHRNKLLHRVQCWSACSCHITIPRWGQCRRQAKFCLGGFTIDEFPHKQTPLYQHCIQRYNGCVSSCNIPFRACLQQNAMSPKDKLKKCLTVHKQCTLKWAGSPSQPNPPVDPQNTDNFKDRFLPNILPTREDVTQSVPSA